MADLGLCDGCAKKHANRTHQCRSCKHKFCTACANQSQRSGKCMNCGKAASTFPNPDV